MKYLPVLILLTACGNGSVSTINNIPQNYEVPKPLYYEIKGMGIASLEGDKNVNN